MKKHFVLLSLMLLTLSVGLRAQAPAPEITQKGKRTFINVPVIVSDREGRYISGLEKDDFTIYQDGVKQKIDFFATEDEPVSVALLIDTSGSTAGVLAKIKDAAKDFIDLMNPKDQCLIATFDSQIKILNPFTSNQKDLKQSLNKIQSAEKEGTLMLRAVDQTSRETFANIPGRKVIVLLSDGKDLGSPVTKTELMSQLEESDVLIYSVFYQTGKGFNKLVVDTNSGVVKEGKVKKPKKPKKPKKRKGYGIVIPVSGDTLTEQEIKLSDQVASVEGVNFLQEMSDTTAGRFYQSDEQDLNKTFKKIAGELRQHYRLGFYTRENVSDANLHNISVKVERPDVVVHARGKFRSKPL